MNRTLRNTILTAVAASLLALGSACETEEPSAPFIPETNEEHNQMLDGLGFSTEVGDRKDHEGDELSETWHPLRTRFAAFFPKQELYVAGADFGTGPESLLDDAVEEWGELELRSNPDTSWVNAVYKNVIAADVDADGYDELMTVYFAPGSGSLKYILTDPNDDAEPVMGIIDHAADATGLHDLAQPSLASGDVDGDGYDEIAVGFGQLYLLEDIVDTMKVTGKGYFDQNDVMVAMGNIDLDSQDELVVTYTETKGATKGYYEIIDGGDLEAPTQDGDLVVTALNNVDYGYAEARVAIGDIDGDRLGDVLFHGRRVAPADNRWSVFVLRNDIYSGTYEFRSVLRDVHTSAEVPWTLAAVDADGDGLDEIFAWNQLIEVADDGTTSRYGNLLPTWPRAVAANIDTDWREELILAHGGETRTYGLDGLDEFVIKDRLFSTISGPRSTVIGAANVDTDSPIVRYNGDHELLFTDPHILTVMAAPPYHAGVGQDVDSTTTTYGHVESSEVVEETSMGVSVGFSVGYEYETNFFGVTSGFSVKATVEAAFDFHASNSKTREDWFSHTTAAGQDKVVFTTVPFDVYYYEVVSSPNPDDIGRTLTVNMPRNQQVLGTSLSFYNNNNGNGLDVDDKIVQHTPGHVWSYPTAEDKERILNEAELTTPGYLRLWNGPLQVDESGSNSLGLSIAEGSAHGAAMDFSSTFEFEAKAGGASVGTSVGFHYGHSYEISTETGSFYEGTVGGLPGSSYADNAYCYGLMVYPQRAGGQSFITVNWWTQRQCGG